MEQLATNRSRFQVILFGLLGLVALASCERDEIPVEPFDRGEVEAILIEMGSDYATQVYYDLGTNSVVATANRTDWDVAFDCSEENYIYLNSAVAGMAASTGSTDFDEVPVPSTLEFRADHPSGAFDSLCLGEWWLNTEEVWVFDLGYTPAGQARGHRKVQFQLNSDGDYQVRYAQLDGSAESTAIITKDDRYNRTAFSFTTEAQIMHEPEKTEYDLLFTTYLNIFYSPTYLPYLVTGTLLNSSGTRAVMDTTRAFEDITAAELLDYEFVEDQAVIGFDWKFYSLETSSFTVYPEMNYVVQDREGFYYKLHFTDFYNSLGEKGHPQMEMKRL